jgi:hypothetical protein
MRPRAGLPVTFDRPVVITQHLPRGGPNVLVDILLDKPEPAQARRAKDRVWDRSAARATRHAHRSLSCERFLAERGAHGSSDHVDSLQSMCAPISRLSTVSARASANGSAPLPRHRSP